MRHFLLNELQDHVNVLELIYDQENYEWYSEPIREYQDIHKREYKKASSKVIPVLEEMILYWSSGWSSYGKEYPNPNDDFLQPVVKTFKPEEAPDVVVQKTIDPMGKRK